MSEERPILQQSLLDQVDDPGTKDQAAGKNWRLGPSEQEGASGVRVVAVLEGLTSKEEVGGMKRMARREEQLRKIEKE